MTKGSVTNGWSTRHYAVLSIAAAVTTIGLKLGAYFLTGSVGLFSDAAESVVNLVAAVAALWALTFAVRPPDEEHYRNGVAALPGTLIWRANCTPD